MVKVCILRVPEECFDVVDEIQKIMKERIGFAPSKTDITQMAIADYYTKQDVLQKGDEQ